MPSSTTLDTFLLDCIRHFFDRPYMCGTATQLENKLRIYFRFAAIVRKCEPQLESAWQKVATRCYTPGRLTEGYYRDHPDAPDSVVREFILGQFHALADALRLHIPPVSTNSLDLPDPIVTETPDGTQEPSTRHAAAFVAQWVRTSLECICSDPTSSRSAYDLEDDLCGLAWVWGIASGQVHGLQKLEQHIRDLHACDTTIASQFFRQRPWATPDDGIRFVFDAYEELRRSILDDRRMYRL